MIAYNTKMHKMIAYNTKMHKMIAYNTKMHKMIREQNDSIQRTAYKRTVYTMIAYNISISGRRSQNSAMTSGSFSHCSVDSHCHKRIKQQPTVNSIMQFFNMRLILMGR